MTSPVPLSTDHVGATINAIAQLHSEYKEQATAFQRAAEFLTAALSNPVAAGVALLAVISWIGGSLLAHRLGYRPWDPPPFTGLVAVVSIGSFFMVIMILATQRNDDRLAFHREQLIMELVVSIEQKTTKVIQLLEEFRRDNPSIRNRIDHEANEMTRPADPSALLSTIRDFNAEPRGGKRG
jgi:uncharacterized membrane protein